MRLAAGGRAALAAAIVLAAIALAALATETLAQRRDSCRECHLELDEEILRSPAVRLEQDIHWKRGLSCVDCHGGNPTTDDPAAAMDPAVGYVGKPAKKDIPAFCGNCHSDGAYLRRFNPALRTDQLAQYRTSVHGKRLAEGDTLVADCTSCHGVHGIRSAGDDDSPVYPKNVPGTCGKCHSDAKTMERYGAPTDALEKYSKSVHGVLLLQKGEMSAPACNDCHGNHGATPPGLASVAHVCGTCHASNDELFQNSPHRAPFEEMEVPACVTCHGNHDVEPPTEALFDSTKGICATCHDPGSKGSEVATAFKGAIDSLTVAIADAESIMARATTAGLSTGDEAFALREAKDLKIRAQNQIHAFSVAAVRELTTAGIAKAAEVKKRSEEALRELRIRRLGFLVYVGIALVLMILLGLKIREIERRAG